MKKALITILNLSVIGGTLCVMILVIFGVLPFSDVQEIIISEGNVWAVGFTLSLLMFLATVIAPITTVFLVPLSAGVIGPLPAALFASVGWFCGSIVAFFLARFFGKPLLLKFFSEEKILLYERYVPQKAELPTLILLRMVVPPDILSYVLGFFSKMRFSVYALGTGIGLLPFAFVGAYAGSALLRGDWYVFSLFGLGGGVLFGLVWFFVIKRKSSIRPM